MAVIRGREGVVQGFRLGHEIMDCRRGGLLQSEVLITTVDGSLKLTVGGLQSAAMGTS